MQRTNKDRPYCFGKIDNVFPMSDNGLRESPEFCRACRYKTACLKAAMQSAEGMQVKQEALDRAYASKMIGFWTRWSRKKTLQRQMKNHRAAKNPGDRQR